MIRLAQRVQSTKGYQRSTQVGPIDLRLDSNEGVAPPLKILINGELVPSSLLSSYPDDLPLRQELATEFGLDADEVIITAGADDALDRICRSLIEPGKNLVVPAPSFEMIPRYVELAGGQCREIPWLTGGFPVAEALQAIDESTAAICVVTPNNPTGLTASIQDLLQISKAAPQCAIILDLAYGEYCGDAMPAELLEIPNLIITRTFSKAWGLAGLRVGYALAAPPLLDALRAAGSPFPVSALSMQLVLGQWQTQRKQMQQQVRATSKIRKRLANSLIKLGCTVGDSQANFVLATVDNPTWLRQGLAGLGIAVRQFPGREYLGNSLRLGCPANEEEMDRLERAMQTVMQPQAMLFDLDGVLADVSQSYRIAISQTCSTFGVSVSGEEIEQLKLVGGFNNDWVLTQELMASKGVERSLEQIREVFDRIYLGEAGKPGLCSQERLLIQPQKLADLASKLSLAIVTGRPRADAQMFLQQHAIGDFFSVQICMEDAVPKPDPAPVKLAMKQLGVDRAWMIGDTVDDIRAARSADVLPLAVLAPEANRNLNLNALAAAGAATVLDSVTQLTELLP